MAATMVNGDRRVTVPDDVRRDLGLEDGVEYIVLRAGGDEIAQPGLSGQRTTSGVAGSIRTTGEQVEELERMLASRRRFASSRLLADEDWDAAIAEAVVEDFLSEDYGPDAVDRR